MKCNDCDAHIDEMLSGCLHPDAIQHMRECERCTSHYRARAMVQNELRRMASAPASGPSLATDRAVMESYRRLQQRRAVARDSEPAAGFVVPTPSLFSFPSRNLSAVRGSRTWWTGAAAAAVVFVVLGSAVHLWKGVPSVNAPIASTAHGPAPQRSAPMNALGSSVPSASNPRTPTPLRAGVVTANAGRTASQRLPHQSPAQLLARATASQAEASRSEVATAAFHAAPHAPGFPTQAAPTQAASTQASVAYDEGSNYDSAPMTQLSPNVSPVMRLASSGAVNNVAQSASSTWPGYSNLMYCDPVVCSGPMQVVHIKVPVGQVKPNLGQTVGNAFVDAEVVIGPDGVARAIRVAN